MIDWIEHGGVGSHRKEDGIQSFPHVAIYAGVTKANHAIKIAKATYSQIEEAKE
ncbi:MAG: hypothetical protein AAFY06_11120 [Pseudomonadota bacterium]